jgi:eukaryotic-like serine/threonine-protein kinase
VQPPSPIHLGPFTLDHPVGKGGMGEVWSAVHRELDVPVAVKVMTAAHVRDREFVASFKGEVRAVAAMDHPGIIRVHDHGSVDAAAQAASGDRLLAGSPWLAMDLVEGGTLDQRLAQGLLAWRQQRSILLALLDALAHAHACGLVHRDLKPANVLLERADEPGEGLILTDFGLAQAGEDRDVAGQTEAPSGTPHYMAPEQFEGHWRDYGPWTDLYALGCLAFRMATGAHPFGGGSMFALAFAHLQGKREPWHARVPVPDGLLDWVDRLLRRAPGERFQRAADAAFALRQLPTIDDGLDFDPSGATDADVDAPTARMVQRVTETRLLSERTMVQQPQAPGRPVPPPMARPEDRISSAPPLPADWRRPRIRSEARSLHLPGAGLGLFGLRTIPLVGREREQDLLWAALAEVRRTGTMRMAVLRGPAGTGKSRLAAQVAQRADEVGSAMVLTARHAPESDAGSGLGPMLARFLRCRGLSRDEIRDRVEVILAAEGEVAEYELLGLTEVMAPADAVQPEAAPFVFSGPAERYGLIRRFLGRIAAGRPLLLHLDDAQWGAEALAFVRLLRGSQQLAPLPVLVLATVRDDLLVQGSEEERLLADLLEQPEVRALDIDALDGAEHRRLVERLLGLRGDLAEAVARRTDGNPLFAVQLVGDLVDRGVLEPSRAGFRLRAGEEAVLPDGIHAVWRQKLSTALAGLPAEARQALQVAAALGGEVDLVEWASACGHLGVGVPEPLVDRLVEGRMARWEISAGAVRRSWSFEHGLLRESLARDARDHGRLAACHEACIAMLRGRHAEQTRGLAGRLAVHLEGAARFEEAAGRWLVAAQDDVILAEYARAEDAVRRSEAALAAANVQPGDARWGEALVRRLTILRHQVRLTEARALALEGRELARTHGWTAHEARFVGDLGDVLHRLGELTEAERLIRQSRAMNLDQGDESEAMGNLRVLASVARIRNELDEAGRLLVRIQGWYREQGDDVQLASTTRDLAMVLIARGDTAGGIAAVAEARAVYDRVGFRMGVVRCLNTLGTALYTDGRYDEAAIALEEGLALDAQVGSGLGSMLAINLAMAEVGRGRFAEAEARILPFLGETRSSPEPLFALFFEAMLLCARTCQGRMDDWVEGIDHVVDLIGETAVIDRDLARMFEAAGREAAHRGRSDVARQALDLALAQRSVLGDADAAAAVRELLRALPDAPD